MPVGVSIGTDLVYYVIFYVVIVFKLQSTIIIDMQSK